MMMMGEREEKGREGKERKGRQGKRMERKGREDKWKEKAKTRHMKTFSHSTGKKEDWGLPDP